VHAGEQRKLNTMAKAQARNAAINEGIALSLREFVHELHHRAGKGRWADKLRQAQQVVATAVSKAAMISRTSYKVIGDALGLDAEMIASCRKRFEALQNDGEWQKLFDDHVAERSE
jgi:ABC-type Fe2+-enterobactin transport system substrate-binding protein